MVETLADEATIYQCILSGYIGRLRYAKNDSFRRIIREKCTSFLDKIRTRKYLGGDDENEIFVDMEFCMQKIDRLIEDQGTKKHSFGISLEF